MAALPPCVCPPTLHRSERCFSCFLTAVTQCLAFNNTNYNGAVLRFAFTQNVGGCCDLCSRQQGCNIYVYCPERFGCDNGYGLRYPPNLCTLKYQTLANGANPSAYGAGPNVPWSSGIVTQTSLGYCIGFAEAAASASATAGCGSIAYAGAVADAVDSCGNTASASALAVAVGGKCPVTCDQAIETVRSAASSSGCGSSAYTDAVNAATALCGASEYASRAAGICPPPTCDVAVASASTAASAGCDTIAYASAVATARSACGTAFASAAASAIGGKCPLDCTGAVAQAKCEFRIIGL